MSKNEMITLPRSVVEQALEALTCTGEHDDPGHRCTHCDDYVDRNGPARAALRAALGQPQGEQEAAAERRYTHTTAARRVLQARGWQVVRLVAYEKW